MNIFEVEAKFIPKGRVKLKSIELHVGKHMFSAEKMPIIMLEHEGTFNIDFKIPGKIGSQISKNPVPLRLRVIGDERDWFSGEFSWGVSI